MVVENSQSRDDTKVAFIFPGQGSQFVGMGLELYQNSSAARDVFEEVGQALDTDISRIIFEGPEEELRKTINAQPGILAVSIACLAAMKETLGDKHMPSPSVVGGHSLGQYTALVAASVLSVRDGALLVRERGRLMQYAAELEAGSMAAIMGMEYADIVGICETTGTEISNMNTPVQTVISGSTDDIVRAMALAESRGARRTVQLAVAGAFHSRLMRPAQSGLTDAINSLDFKEPTVPIIANCTGLPIAGIDQIKHELITGLCSCVRWTDSMTYMTGLGIDKFYEIGPGKVLSGMLGRIDPDVTVINIDGTDPIKDPSNTA